MNKPQSFDMERHDIDFTDRETKRLMGLKLHEGGVKPTNSLEWEIVVASVR